MSVRSVWNNFWCSGEKHGLLLQICKCVYFICGIIWVVDSFMLLVHIWTLTSCTKYQVFVSSMVLLF